MKTFSQKPFWTHSRKLTFVCCILSLTYNPSCFGENPNRNRTWRDSSATFSVQARFLEMNGNKVKLETPTKQILEIDLLKLSSKDKEYVRLTNLGKEPGKEFDEIARESGLILDLSNDEKFYKFSIPYAQKVDLKDIYVNTQIVINPYDGLEDRYKVETAQHSPIQIKGLKIKRFTVEMGANPAGQMGFDVSTQTTYNPRDKSFYFVVRPTIRVIRGKPGASTTELQKEAISHRLDATIKQISKNKLFISGFPAAHAAQVNFINNLQGQFRAAIARCNLPLAQALQGQLSREDIKLMKLKNNLTSAKASIPKHETEVAYLEELTKALDGIQHILVKFEIYNDSAGKQVIISGQHLPARQSND